jgi:hypothetical protein
LFSNPRHILFYWIRVKFWFGRLIWLLYYSSIEYLVNPHCIKRRKYSKILKNNILAFLYYIVTGFSFLYSFHKTYEHKEEYRSISFHCIDVRSFQSVFL